ncbi:Putative N-acetylmannosamine-6-phosphate 2-epimerase [Roseibium album]|nr:Putative N-acetylmannosamine-6-phosphate 2-epimerase [Roseibium album]
MSLLDKLRNGLVVSCQPVDGGPMDTPEIVAAMAKAALAGGAAGLRIEGVGNLQAVRSIVSVPIIGIVKRDAPETPVRITPRVADALELVEAGADIVAFDATDRPRQDSRENVLAAVLRSGALAMADCATVEDAQFAHAAGVAILGTTLSGYTKETAGQGEAPDLELVRDFSTFGSFVMAEGRYITPALASAAMQAGADCVTVGSAITRPEHVTGWFCEALKARDPL